MGNDRERDLAEGISGAFGGSKNKKRHGTSKYAAGSTNVDKDGLLSRLGTAISNFIHGGEPREPRTGTARSEPIIGGSESEEPSDFEQKMQKQWDEEWSVNGKVLDRQNLGMAHLAKNGEPLGVTETNDTAYVYEDPLGTQWVQLRKFDDEKEEWTRKFYPIEETEYEIHELFPKPD